MNNLYGNKFIEKQRSSGYKSTVYAMAEIVDNSVDAKATKIDIVLVESQKTTGQKKTNELSEIYFLDNGKGMSQKRINSCLTFSEGEGSSNTRIGSFGVGLPNSSISVGRKVEVYSKDENEVWNYVFLDLDDQSSRSEPGFDPAIEQVPNFDPLIRIDSGIRTIIKWSKIDLVEGKASTIISRAGQLLGRIYRYALNKGIEINYYTFLDGNATYTESPKSIIPYDPLFLMTKKNFITEHIWKWASVEDNSGKHVELGDDPEFNSIHHYKKFIVGCTENETNLALFQKYDDYWDVEYDIQFGNKTYKWRIKASLATSSITNPGIRNGGGTTLGRKFGDKMNSTKDFRSGNIFFIRANREIDFGNFSLFTVTDVKNRFWTIEIHFDSDLDELMGISNNKQSVAFKAVSQEQIESAENHEDLPIGAKRELLYAQMTEKITRCISGMRKVHAEYSKNFKEKEQSKLASNDKIKHPIPQPETAVIEVIPTGGKWSTEQKEEVINFLREKYLHLEPEVIKQQVDIFAKGLTKTIVLYSSNESNNLFELTEKRGKFITIINTNHIYYTNIIEPLKSNRHLKIFAIAIEMLISSSAIEMERLVNDNKEKYKASLDVYLLQLSSRLNEFISDSQIKIVPEEFEKQLVKDAAEEAAS